MAASTAFEEGGATPGVPLLDSGAGSGSPLPGMAGCVSLRISSNTSSTSRSSRIRSEDAWGTAPAAWPLADRHRDGAGYNAVGTWVATVNRRCFAPDRFALETSPLAEHRFWGTRCLGPEECPESGANSAVVPRALSDHAAPFSADRRTVHGPG
jgi:hypothetical protein